jgi:hypothetical protein
MNREHIWSNLSKLDIRSKMAHQSQILKHYSESYQHFFNLLFAFFIRHFGSNHHFHLTRQNMLSIYFADQKTKILAIVPKRQVVGVAKMYADGNGV